MTPVELAKVEAWIRTTKERAFRERPAEILVSWEQLSRLQEYSNHIAINDACYKEPSLGVGLQLAGLPVRAVEGE